MDKKVTLLILIFLLSISLASAVDELIFKQYETITLKRTCYDANNTWCSSSVSCNITVIDDNKTIVNNKAMTYNPSFFSYNLGKINETGIFNAFMMCSDGVTSGFDDFSFRITRTGAELSSYNVTLYIISIISIIIFAVMLLVLSTKIKFDSEKLWVANLTTVIKWFMINLAAICLYVILAIVRFILDTQSKGQELGLKFIDYFMIVVLFFGALFFIGSFVMMINSFIENSMKNKEMMEHDEW